MAEIPSATAVPPEVASGSSLASLWQESWDTYYDAHYQEIEAEVVAGSWQRFDDIVKVVVALTASSSAIAGWALWNNPSFKTAWAIIAGLGALLAIIHASLGVPARLREWGEVQRHFVTVRNDLQALRQQMRINSHFPLSAFTADFVECRRRYGEGLQRVKGDLLRTPALRQKAQEELNRRISDRIGNRHRRQDNA